MYVRAGRPAFARPCVGVHKSTSLMSSSLSSVASTEKDIDTRLTKAWTAINRLSIIWKSDLTDKMKRSFFQAAVASILLYGCTTWTLTKRLEKKLDGNYTRMLRAILHKSWRQHPTRHQLYGYLPPITKTIQVVYIYILIYYLPAFTVTRKKEKRKKNRQEQEIKISRITAHIYNIYNTVEFPWELLASL